jgi:hypothetical protein
MDTAAIVSETDAAPQSSGDEDDGWLSSIRHQGLNNTLHEDTDSDYDDDENAEDNMEGDEDGTTDLYCGNMDDEDEAWVYKNMRGGQEELVQLRHTTMSASSIHSHKKKDTAMTDVDEETKNDNDRVSKKLKEDINDTNNDEEIGQECKSLNNTTNNNDEEKQHPPTTLMTPHKSQIKQALLLKPRTSDAVLSCPRCFTTVCMDCQQHERYANQFRAMFVMNIGVDWNKRMVYDDTVGGLKLDNDTTTTGDRGISGISMHLDNDDNNNVAPDVIAPEPSMSAAAATSLRVEGGEENVTPLYYSVHCGYCQYEVAALDMSDEVYYFYACIASA